MLNTPVPSAVDGVAIAKRLEMEERGDVVSQGGETLGGMGSPRWGKAFMLVDIDDPAAFMGMCTAWSDVVSMEVVPVLGRKDIKKLRSRSK